MHRKKRFWKLVAEALVLFAGIPLLVFWDLIPLPKIVVLVLVAGYCAFQLWQDSSFSGDFFDRESDSEVSKAILVRSALVVAALIFLVWAVQPDQFFSFPAQQPVVWMVVMVLYPLLSALPQELIYRTYFFHRYGDIISPKNATIISSALAFAFVHIIYDNWWAVGLSFVGGILFGLTYARTKSLFWVTVEHAIYGCLIFTLGMGNYFYEPF